MHHDDIQKIIDDLYKIDPSLRSHDAELRRLVAEILKAKPDARYDERFKEELSDKIRMAIEEKGASQAQKTTKTFRPWLFATAGLSLIALVLIAAKPGIAPLTPTTGSQVAVLAPGAFGDLSGATAGSGLGSAEAMSSRPQGLGGGGGGRGIAVGEPAPSSPVADSKMYPPQDWHPVYVKYSYAGDPLEFGEQSVDVLRRARGARPAAPSSLLSASGTALDISKFEGRLDSYVITEDKEFGYIVYVNTTDGSVNISQNWQHWPHPEMNCMDDACRESFMLKPSDVPSDEEATRIADAFLAERGVDLAGFGRPTAQGGDWLVAYEKTEDKRYAYVPESVTLVYPLLIDGAPAYDEGGNPAGLYVGVNARHKRVDNVSGLAGRDFERSSYPAIAKDDILGIVERGGIYGPTSYEPNAEIVDVTVGTPEKVLMRVWAPTTDGYAQELYVPALRFPVTSAPGRDDVYLPKSVVVPLAESLAKPPAQPTPALMVK